MQSDKTFRLLKDPIQPIPYRWCRNVLLKPPTRRQPPLYPNPIPRHPLYHHSDNSATRRQQARQTARLLPSARAHIRVRQCPTRRRPATPITRHPLHPLLHRLPLDRKTLLPRFMVMKLHAALQYQTLFLYIIPSKPRCLLTLYRVDGSSNGQFPLFVFIFSLSWPSLHCFVSPASTFYSCLFIALIGMSSAFLIVQVLQSSHMDFHIPTLIAFTPLHSQSHRIASPSSIS